jgi:integrase/recombinase XerC
MTLPNPLSTALISFRDNLKSSGRANATILAYTKDIEQLLEFVAKNGKTTLEQIDTDDINNFKADLKEQKYTDKSVSRKINSVKSFFKYLVSQKKLSTNPATPVTHPKYELKPPRILSKIEYRALRDSCRHDSRIFAIVEILLQTGIRIGELAKLTIEDIDFTNGKMIIRAYESHEQRTVPLNQPVIEALKSYLEVRPKTEKKEIFITKTGNPFLVRNIRSSLDRHFRLAGIEDTKVNDLRHTFIAHQIKSGTPLVFLSKLVGHKRLSTTEKYLEFVKEKSKNDKPKLSEL